MRENCITEILINDDLEQIDEQRCEVLLAQLPEWRREAALRFRHLAGRRECAVAYLSLLELLEKHYGITAPPTFDIGPHGKPSLLEHPSVHFNTSHCRTAVIAAVSDRPIGVDVESRRVVRDALMRYVMNDEEMMLIRQSDDPEMEFLRLWTAKEAVVKLSGNGLQVDIPGILEQARLEGVSIQTFVNKERDYVYSVAQHGS